jgi:hypothetical protein
MSNHESDAEITASNVSVAGVFLKTKTDIEKFVTENVDNPQLIQFSNSRDESVVGDRFVKGCFIGKTNASAVHERVTNLSELGACIVNEQLLLRREVKISQMSSEIDLVGEMYANRARGLAESEPVIKTISHISNAMGSSMKQKLTLLKQTDSLRDVLFERVGIHLARDNTFLLFAFDIQTDKMVSKNTGNFSFLCACVTVLPRVSSEHEWQQVLEHTDAVGQASEGKDTNERARLALRSRMELDKKLAYC